MYLIYYIVQCYIIYILTFDALTSMYKCFYLTRDSCDSFYAIDIDRAIGPSRHDGDVKVPLISFSNQTSVYMKQLFHSYLDVNILAVLLLP